MGRRRKDEVYQQAHVVGTTVRNNSLNKLVFLHNAVAEIWSSNRQGSKLFKELVKKRRKDCPDCVKYAYEEPAYLICHYLSSDDVMKVLDCNRRTALDYLQALREIVRCYKGFYNHVVPHPFFELAEHQSQRATHLHSAFLEYATSLCSLDVERSLGD